MVARAPPVTSAVASSLASDDGLVLILLHPPHQPPDPDNQTVSAGDERVDFICRVCII